MSSHNMTIEEMDRNELENELRDAYDEKGSLQERIKELEANEQAMNDAHCKLMDKVEAAKPKWISVKDMLPEDEEDVVCIDKDEFMYLAYHETYVRSSIKEFDEAWWNKDGGLINEVTHWMPLPPPPTTATEKEDK